MPASPHNWIVRPLTILFTNTTLSGRSGTELYIREAAGELVRRGHRPIVYSPDCGEIAGEIRQLTVPVVDDIRHMGEHPDIIHGHHTHETLTALLAFPQTPAIFIVHDWSSWHDTPLRFPRIARWIAVDRTVRDRLTIEHGIDPDRVEVLGNWADTNRFVVRAPLPSKPRRALVYSNYVASDRNLPQIEDACARAGITLETAGLRLSGSIREPERLIGQYDVVFAKAKSAMEALAAGCSVILCDASGLGPLVTRSNVDALLEYNLGRRLLSATVTAEAILERLQGYDAADAALVTSRVRELRNIERGVDALLDLYGRVVAEPLRCGDEQAAMIDYLQEWSGWRHPLKAELQRVDEARLQLETYVEILQKRSILGALRRRLARRR